ncbi:MAG: ATP-dependent DNA helicase RecG [Clostridiales bacterium]|nr:ATP-dependent DNA helicase RecG [Clostridiales bacterium]
MLEKIKGIGPKTKELLNKLNIYTINDLLTYYPFRYDYLRRTDLLNLKENISDIKIVMDGKVDSVVIMNHFKKINKISFRIETVYGKMGVILFNRAFLKNNLRIGTNIVVIGKYDKKNNVLVASDILFKSLGTKEEIIPVYHLTSGITSNTLKKFINEALLSYKDQVVDNIPKYLNDKYNFVSKKLALSIVHNPSDKEKLEEVLKRLKYEELFEFMFKINYLKYKRKKENIGIKREVDIQKLDKVIKSLPFELTEDQLKTTYDIIEDLSSEKQMNRIIQGDVGSGKTIVSFLAIYYNFLSGYQSALMAPTEILAIQHYNNLKELNFAKNLKIELLVGKLKKKEKEDIYKAIEKGEVDVVIGTHAIIQEALKYHNLGLVITDEQHRFGVNQRANLKNKGNYPDVLYMSATPIPRTYALTIYGDMDISSIKKMPKGRKPVETIIKSEEEMKEVLEMMYKELINNHQIYVISPLIEENDNSDLNDVEKIENNMKKAFGSKFNIGVMHGKMKTAEKELIMQEFKQKKIDILVSTTVIEVGVDVENATMIVIFDADRFGLSTLHQLRGRVGRSSLESKCILISNTDKERLNIMTKTTDGFKISEEDFKLRGSGDLFGTKQSGDMSFKLANLKQDYNLLINAKTDTEEFLKNKNPEDIELKLRLIKMVNDNS